MCQPCIVSATALSDAQINFPRTAIVYYVRSGKQYKLLRLGYHHFSGLSFIVEVNFWRPPKPVNSCDLFIPIIIIIIIIFFRQVFSECTEAIAT